MPRRAPASRTVGTTTADTVRPPAGAAPLPPDPIRVLFCCDPGYYQHLAVAIASLALSNPRSALDIHLITSARDPACEDRLRASVPRRPGLSLHIHDLTWEGRPQWHTSFHITREAYTRLFAPEILGADIDRVLYLDCDLVVVGDLMELWRTDLTDHALGAVPDPFGGDRPAALGMPANAAYVNSGVLLMNLAWWRSHDVTARLADYIERQSTRLLFHDQDALNAVLHRSIRVLDPRWNVQAKMLRPSRTVPAARRAEMRKVARAPAVVHYTSASKPWLFVMATPGKRLYRRYLRLTAWRGTPPAGRRWSALPAFCTNHLMYFLRIDYTWERILRSTAIGRVIERSMRGLGLRQAT